jgi:ribosomal protein L16 Arg81 hydroxylase
VEAAMDSNGKLLDCMTYSIGFKAPAQSDLTAEAAARVGREFNEMRMRTVQT